MSICAIQLTPILLFLSVEESRELSFDFVGFDLDWEQRHEPAASPGRKDSRDWLDLHLSERYGDGSHGTHFEADSEDVHRLLDEPAVKSNSYWQRGITETSSQATSAQ
jgi:hypothetical protein